MRSPPGASNNKVRQTHHQRASKAIVPLASGGQREWCQPQQGNATQEEAIMASIFKAVTPASRSGAGSRSKTSGNSKSDNSGPSGASTTTNNTD